ncbi:phosphoglycerate mutase-like protein [Cytidiella melzeri]|nr:phosphoglycerate mutase-like protein [Cytidiella melzeri]
MSPVLNVYLVRHGETDENRAMIMQGQLDTQLNAAGLEQAQLTAKALENVRFAAAYSSDLSRAVKTAETILEKHPNVLLQKHKALRERYMGSLEGKEIGQTGKIGLPSDLEPSVTFSARAQTWWKDTILPLLHNKFAQTTSSDRLDEPQDGSTNILVVSHGGLMHVMVQDLIGSRKVKVAREIKIGRFRFPNASVSVIEVEESGKGALVLFADTTHLDVELLHANADVLDE